MYWRLLEKLQRASVLQDSGLQQQSDTRPLFSRALSRFWTPKRKLTHLILPALILIFCGYLRFVNLGWGTAGKYKAGWHPDEQIVVGVDGNLASNHFDSDMGLAPIPEGLRWARYNFSSYFYASYVWYAVAAPIRSALHLGRVQAPPSPLMMFRQFSALLGLTACFLVYCCARTFLPSGFAALAALFTGVLPLLVQDSHYARAEAFVTAGAVGLLWLTFTAAEKCSPARCFWAGLLTGILAACKISLAPLLLLPAFAIWACLWPIGRRKVRLAITRLGLLLSGFVAGFVIGVPYVVVHWRTWWQGWQVLENQYSHPFPPYGTDPPGYCFGFIANYVVSTFGVPLLILAALGAFRLVRKRFFFPVFFLVGPVVLYYVIFGFQLAFFERNISHVAPWIAILAATGCLEVWDRLKRATAATELRLAMMVVTIGLCLWVPLPLSWRIAVIVLSGHTYDAIGKYEAVLLAAYHGLPMIGDELWADQVLEHIQQNLIINPGGYILKLGDSNDELSRHRRFIAEHTFNMKLLAVLPGHFSDLPVCTLQMYHSENYSWYLVRQNWPAVR